VVHSGQLTKCMQPPLARLTLAQNRRDGPEHLRGRRSVDARQLKLQASLGIQHRQDQASSPLALFPTAAARMGSRVEMLGRVTLGVSRPTVCPLAPAMDRDLILRENVNSSLKKKQEVRA
jgi:hypothetical protein